MSEVVFSDKTVRADVLEVRGDAARVRYLEGPWEDMTQTVPLDSVVDSDD